MILKGQHIIIFGASSGIGHSLYKACYTAGALLSLGSRRTISVDPSQCFSHSVDVTDRQQVNSFVKKAVEKWGPFTAVINCVGVMYYQVMANSDYQQWQSMIDTNIYGFLNITQSVLPTLINQKGCYVNITSDAGKKPFAGLAVYSGSKAFMEFTLQAMRQELVNSKVRIVNIQPGNVKTPLHDLSTETAAINRYASQNDQGFLDPDAIAQAVIYALTQPNNVAVNELLIEPIDEPI